MLLALPGRELADEQRLGGDLVLDAGRAETALLESSRNGKPRRAGSSR